MNKIWIIIQREFLVRVKKKSFILLTILMPFLIVGIVALPVWLSTLKSGDVTRVAVIDTDGSYQSLFTENEDDIVFTSFVAAEPDVQLLLRWRSSQGCGALCNQTSHSGIAKGPTS